MAVRRNSLAGAAAAAAARWCTMAQRDVSVISSSRPGVLPVIHLLVFAFCMFPTPWAGAVPVVYDATR